MAIYGVSTDDTVESDALLVEGTLVFKWDDECILTINPHGNAAITPRAMNTGA